jgi:hypothetical protein
VREPAPDYSATRYERPNQPWVCGLANQGESCPAGPTARGCCPALGECAPLRNSDRWECNRSQLRGGPCDAGPTPEGQCGRVLKCHPLRSLRAIRGRFVRACACLVIGAAIAGLSANWRDRVIAPGPLARQHAQLLERTGAAANCAACHVAAGENIRGWVVSLVVSRGDELSQSQLCTNCHAKTIQAGLSTAAHNVPSEVLKHIQATRTLPRTASTPLTAGVPTREGSSIECAACHVEHHGTQVDLTAINNVACQSCHQRRFESFATDHPDFGIWPYERRTRIAFNHAAHRDKHFVERKQGFDCRKCHIDDSTGKVQLLASYEAACAACHDEKMSTSVARGVPMLVIPTLDVAALKAAGLDIGTWPKGATGDFDGRLPSAMKLLLAADPAAAQAMTKLGADFDFQDVNPKDRHQLDACAALATAIKKLMVDVAGSPDVAIRDRLQTLLGRPITDAQVGELVAGLSADTLRSAVNAWGIGANGSSGLSTAMESKAPSPRHGESQATRPSPGGRGSSERPIVFAPVGNWVRDDGSFSIRHQPRGHADSVFFTLLNVLADTPNLNQRPVAAAAFKELSKPNAPGLCLSCHSVERSPNSQLVVNWRAFDRSAEPRAFTKFSHGPHLLLPQLADCTHCHSTDTKASATVAYTDVDPTRFVSDFVALSKRQCVECHTAKVAGDRCQSCHNYHVEGSGFGVQGSVSKSLLLNPEP